MSYTFSNIPFLNIYYVVVVDRTPLQAYKNGRRKTVCNLISPALNRRTVSKSISYVLFFLHERLFILLGCFFSTDNRQPGLSNAGANRIPFPDILRFSNAYSVHRYVTTSHGDAYSFTGDLQPQLVPY